MPSEIRASIDRSFNFRSRDGRGLDCRTDGHGVTHDHTLAELDIGYGYTGDGGKTYPLRGRGVGMMPTLEEVLAALPDKKLLIHQKDGYIRTAEILAEIVKKESLPLPQKVLR